MTNPCMVYMRANNEMVAADFIGDLRADTWHLRSHPALIPRDAVPRSAYVTTRREHLPDWLGAGGCALVSERFFRMADGLEPGVNQYIPVTVQRGKTGQGTTRSGLSCEPLPYYYLNILQRADAIDLERSGLADQAGRILGRLSFQRGLADYWFDATKFAGRHLWQGHNHFRGYKFVSAELAERMHAEKTYSGCSLIPLQIA